MAKGGEKIKRDWDFRVISDTPVALGKSFTLCIVSQLI